MAKCRRCNAPYDYKKTEGVCPKCAYYNRPVEQEWEDTSWLRNYNVDDNSYIPPKISWDLEEYDSSKKTKAVKEKKQKKEGSRIKKIIILIILINVFRIFFTDVIDSVSEYLQFKMKTISGNTNGADQNDQEKPVVDELTADEARKGFVTGDMFYKIGDVQVIEATDAFHFVPDEKKLVAIDLTVEKAGDIGYFRRYEYAPLVWDGEEYQTMYNIEARKQGDMRNDEQGEVFSFETDPQCMKLLGEKVKKRGFFDKHHSNEGYALYCVNKDADQIEIYFYANELNENEEYEFTNHFTYVVIPLA